MRPTEVRPALRLVLGPPGRPATEPVVDDFLRYVQARRVDLSAVRVVRSGKRLSFAALPMRTPGGLCMIMLPPDLGRGVEEEAATWVLNALLESEAAEGMKAAQSLVSPQAGALRRVLSNCGFDELATLVYLQRRAHSLRTRYMTPDGYRLESYTAARHSLFARAIERSYVDSLDCPGLSGMRTAEEAMQTHRNAGEHRPEWWRVLGRDGVKGVEPAGVLLLSGIGRDGAGGLELVYLGLAPAARGQGLGNLLMQVALREASMTRGATLTLAADEQNTKALALYRRHGLVRVHRRVAMLRDLRGERDLGARSRENLRRPAVRAGMFPTDCSQNAARGAKVVDQNCFERAKPCSFDAKALVK